MSMAIEKPAKTNCLSWFYFMHLFNSFKHFYRVAFAEYS